MEPTGSTRGGVTVAPPVPAGRRAVLYSVRRSGDATAEDVASDLGITVSGARQQLTALAERQLVEAAELARPAGLRGRPQLSYHVTELGDALFPKAYGALTNELLGYLDDEDEQVVDRLFQRRREHRILAAQRRLRPARSLWAKVSELARILDEDGYLASAERLGRDHFHLVEHNCAIASVARRYGQACSSEIEFIRAVLPEATVKRVSHMVEGARNCGYEIRRAAH
ncbi:MAG: transcriptional regulator [Actinomycetota bacterium]|nr:transcriptional regulator [Actinomycetota bacterium]